MMGGRRTDSDAGSIDQRRAEAAAGMQELRQRIDRLDEELVRLLNARASCALTIGALKHVLGLEIHQPEREVEVLEHVRSINGGPLERDAITRLFERIIDEARRLERLAQQERERSG